MGLREFLSRKRDSSKRLIRSFGVHLQSNNAPSARGSTAIHNAEAKESDHRSYIADSSMDSLESHNAALASLRCLPVEILIEIFLKFDSLEEHGDPSQNMPPWVLTHVCKGWRDIAIQVPALWKNLPPSTLGSTDKDELKRRLDCLSTVLARSSSEKLSFFLSKEKTPSEDDHILSMLFNHSERWKTVSLWLSEDVCAHFSRVKGRVPSLCSLNLFINRTGRLCVDMFDVAPSLRTVNLGSLPWAGLVKLPWHQLTSFAEESGENNHLRSVLNEAKDLRELSFIFHRDSFDDFENYPNVTLAHLKTLVIEDCANRFGPNPLFDRLTLPAMQELVFKGHTSLYTLGNLSLMVERSTSLLQKLVLQKASLRPGEVEGILLQTPHLVQLEIYSSRVEVLRLLQCRDYAGQGASEWQLVPSLQSLTICIGEVYLELLELKHLARARCDQLQQIAGTPVYTLPTRLETFRIKPPGYHHPINYAEYFGLRTSNFEIQNPPSINREILTSNNHWELHIQSLELICGDVRPSRKSRLKMITKELASMIKFLERMEVTPEFVNFLYLKRVKHTIMEILLDLPIPTDTKSRLNSRLDTLISIWTPVLQNVSSELRWGWDSEGGLLYIPEGSRNRNCVHFDFN
ncbi:hypothetical protein CVT26_003454 [Gymnopilus dilepis]|uniref:Uncharacterized protein n=1 Tax=Gymnopilus dilepis TaxID=231916 RepID=A0A409Y5A9_9AGAR|nr:hypothetical protein CVT26_003454 [Gymnopilus dilepis]